jgi:ATP-dependent Clp protease ATP-binding subunit ClpA
MMMSRRQALVEAAPPRKALPGPKDKKDKPTRSGGAVSSVPRKKED